MAFFEGCPVGWRGGVLTGAGLVDGGGRPRALIPGEGVREGLAWLGGRGQGGQGLGGGGGARASVPGG